VDEPPETPEREPLRLSKSQLITGGVAITVLLIVVACVAFVAGRHGSPGASRPIATTPDVTTTVDPGAQTRAWYRGVNATLDQLDAADATATNATATKDQAGQCTSSEQITLLAQALLRSAPPPEPELQPQWSSMISAANNLGSTLVTVCTYLHSDDQAALKFMGPLVLAATTANSTAIAGFKATLARLAPAP
jgi:hypothetical protein